MGPSPNRLCRGERGANVVEFVLVAPLLLLLGFGLVEAGRAWRDTLTVHTSARAGARIASNLGDERLADWAVIRAVRAALGDIDDNALQQVIIYRPESDGSVPASCLVGGGRSVRDRCNAYTPSQVRDLSEADFAGTRRCRGSDPDRAWCPTARSTRQGQLDDIGVYVRVGHDLSTGLLPAKSLTIEVRAVMRIEPRLETSI